MKCVVTCGVQEYAAATAEAEMAEAKSVRQGEEAEAFRRIADEKRSLAYQLADKWTGLPSPPRIFFLLYTLWSEFHMESNLT